MVCRCISNLYCCFPVFRERKTGLALPPVLCYRYAQDDPPVFRERKTGLVSIFRRSHGTLRAHSRFFVPEKPEYMSLRYNLTISRFFVIEKPGDGRLIMICICILTSVIYSTSASRRSSSRNIIVDCTSAAQRDASFTGKDKQSTISPERAGLQQHHLCCRCRAFLCSCSSIFVNGQGSR